MNIKSFFNILETVLGIRFICRFNSLIIRLDTLQFSDYCEPSEILPILVNYKDLLDYTEQEEDDYIFLKINNYLLIGIRDVSMYLNNNNYKSILIENIYDDVKLLTKMCLYLVKTDDIESVKKTIIRLITDENQKELTELIMKDMKSENDKCVIEREGILRELLLARQNLSILANRYNIIMTLHNNANISALVNNLMVEIENIKKHKLTDSFSIDIKRRTFVINTAPLYITETNNNKRYYLGRMIIEMPIDASNNQIRFKNIDNCRNNMWGHCAHPHVNGEGHGCLGTAEPQIVEYGSNRMYYPLYITLLNYLQSVNIEDSAGAYIVRWDEVDENGTIVNLGDTSIGDLDNDWEYHCSHCGVGMYEDDVYTCEECNDVYCEDHIVEIGDGYWVCENCFEYMKNNNKISQCLNCGDWFLNEDINESGYCNDCVE